MGLCLFGLVGAGSGVAVWGGVWYVEFWRGYSRQARRVRVRNVLAMPGKLLVMQGMAGMAGKSPQGMNWIVEALRSEAGEDGEYGHVKARYGKATRG